MHVIFSVRLPLIFSTLMLCASTVQAQEKAPPVVEHGGASYYADKFQGRTTASGEPHDQNALTAASKDLPLGSTATVTNLKNGKTVDVEITDRGPYAPGRVIDLSKRAATSIGIGAKQGVAPVRVEANAANQPTAELKEKVAKVGEAKADQAKAATRQAHKRALPSHKPAAHLPN